MVSVLVPAGVPGVPPPPPAGGAGPPPPQEAQSPAKSTIVANPVVAIRMTDATGRVARNPPFRFRVFSVASRPSIASSPKAGTHGNLGESDGGPGGGPNIDRAVVVTFTVTIASFVPSRGVTMAGETEQLARAGAPLQLIETSPEKPSVVSKSSYIAVCPAVTVSISEEPIATEIEKSVEILARKASEKPPLNLAWKGFTVGKSVESVKPVT